MFFNLPCIPVSYNQSIGLFLVGWEGPVIFTGFLKHCNNSQHILYSGSVAYKIMSKYGFKEGRGLGKDKQGMSHALQVRLRLPMKY